MGELCAFRAGDCGGSCLYLPVRRMHEAFSASANKEEKWDRDCELYSFAITVG